MKKENAPKTEASGEANLAVQTRTSEQSDFEDFPGVEPKASSPTDTASESPRNSRRRRKFSSRTRSPQLGASVTEIQKPEKVRLQMSQRTGTGKRRRRKRPSRRSSFDDTQRPEDTSATSAAVTRRSSPKIAPLIALKPKSSRQEMPMEASKVSPIEDIKDTGKGKSEIKHSLSSSNTLSDENTESTKTEDEKQKPDGLWLPRKSSKVSPLKKLQKEIRHVQLASRATSHSWTKGERNKYREDAIGRQVLWMALITHLGKRTKMNVNIKKRCVLGPHSLFRTYWDAVSMLCIIYVICFTPLQVAFMAEPLMETSIQKASEWGSDCAQGNVPCFNYWGFFAMDLFIDIFFTTDIVINFRTAWIDTDPYSPMFKSTQYSCKAASWKYVKGWLLIDVLSVLPFWVLEFLPGIDSGTLLRVPRLLRLAKLTKLLRVLRASRVFDRWNKAITTTCTTKFVLLVELVVVLFVSVHLMGCFWYLIADLRIGFDAAYQAKYDVDLNATASPMPNTSSVEGGVREWWDGNTWIMRAEDFQRKSLAEMYLASIYFALMTITTTGYGDIVAVIYSERLTAFACMLIGVIVFAYVVGQVALLIRLCTVRRNLFFEDMATLQAYLASYPFGKAMRTRAIDYFYYTYNKKQYHFDNEARRSTISHFSPYLQRSLAYDELKHFLVGWRISPANPHTIRASNSNVSYPQPLHFLSRASQHIIKDLCAALKCEVHGPVEMIAYQGGPCTKMFTLDQGCMCKWANRYCEDNPKLVGWEYVQKGARFGADSLLLHLDPFKLRHQTAYNCVWFQSFQTLTFCDFVCLAADDFAKILQRYPKQVRNMRPAILRAKLRMFFRSMMALDRKIMLEAAEQAQEVHRQSISIRNSITASQKLLEANFIEETSAPNSILKQVVNLRKQNSELKDVVKDIQKQLLEQRSKFDEQIVQQRRTLKHKNKEIMQQQQRIEKQQQRMVAQQQHMQQTMKEQRETLAQQHKELLALFKSSKI